MAVLNDGSVLIAGAISTTGQEGFVVKYTSTGVLDTNFFNNGYFDLSDTDGTILTSVLFLGLTLDGVDLYICGNRTLSAGGTIGSVWKISSAGVANSDFGGEEGLAPVSLLDNSSSFNSSMINSLFLKFDGSLIISGSGIDTSNNYYRIVNQAAFRQTTHRGSFDTAFSLSGIFYPLGETTTGAISNFVKDGTRLLAAVTLTSETVVVAYK